MLDGSLSEHHSYVWYSNDMVLIVPVFLRYMYLVEGYLCYMMMYE
jgi:hypothetical protein